MSRHRQALEDLVREHGCTPPWMGEEGKPWRYFGSAKLPLPPAPGREEQLAREFIAYILAQRYLNARV